MGHDSSLAFTLPKEETRNDLEFDMKDSEGDMRIELQEYFLVEDFLVEDFLVEDVTHSSSVRAHQNPKFGIMPGDGKKWGKIEQVVFMIMKN